MWAHFCKNKALLLSTWVGTVNSDCLTDIVSEGCVLLQVVSASDCASICIKMVWIGGNTGSDPLEEAPQEYQE